MVTYSLLLFTDCLSVGSLDHAASDRLVEVIREVVGVAGGLPILNAVNTTAPQLQPKHFIPSPIITSRHHTFLERSSESHVEV